MCSRHITAETSKMHYVWDVMEKKSIFCFTNLYFVDNQGNKSIKLYKYKQSANIFKI